MKTIYLIGDTGAARTSDEGMATALEHLGYYHRCTQQEYLQKMREIRALDLPAQADTPAAPTKPPATPPAETLAYRWQSHWQIASNTADSTDVICPDCGTPMYWKNCDVCGGEGYIDAHNFNPLKYNPGDMMMMCEHCLGICGRYVCPNCHNHPTEKERTARGQNVSI